jgi:hypothetical protein
VHEAALRWRCSGGKDALDYVIAASRVPVLVLVASTIVACGSAKPPVHSQAAQIRVENDASKPVEGASVLVNGEAVGATRNDGRTEVQVRGIAGDRFRINLNCPDGYRPATPDVHEIYVTPSLSGPAPELFFRCESTVRKAIIAVRAENGAGLPIRYLGREVGKTDDHGAATVIIQGTEGEPFELVIDTSKAPKLHPQNPALTYRMGPKDDSFVFDQKFIVEKPKKVVAARPFVPVKL